MLRDPNDDMVLETAINGSPTDSEEVKVPFFEL
jgi:hypothetical protein